MSAKTQRYARRYIELGYALIPVPRSQRTLTTLAESANGTRWKRPATPW